MAVAREVHRHRDRGAGLPIRSWLRRLLGRRAWTRPIKPVLNLNQIRRIAYL